jgi:hypothetical protein
LIDQQTADSREEKKRRRREEGKHFLFLLSKMYL